MRFRRRLAVVLGSLFRSPGPYEAGARGGGPLALIDEYILADLVFPAASPAAAGDQAGAAA